MRAEIRLPVQAILSPSTPMSLRLLPLCLALFSLPCLAGGLQGGRISGLVQDAQGNPLAGIEVRVQPAAAPEILLATGGDGRYDTGPVLAAGSYSVRTTVADGWVNLLWPDTPCIPFCQPEPQNLLQLASGEEREADFSLEPGAGFSGRLRNAQLGTGVDGMVYLHDAGGRLLTVMSTAPDGSYSVPRALPAGDYRLFASSAALRPSLYPDTPCPAPLDCDPLQAEPLLLEAGQSQPDVDFLLAPGMRIEGTVTAAQGGVPIEGRILLLYRPDGSLAAAINSLFDGSFAFFGALGIGTYRMVVQPGPDYLGQAFPGIDCAPQCDPALAQDIAVLGTGTLSLAVTLTRGATLGGRVTEPDGLTPVPGQAVTVYAAGGAAVSLGFSGGDGHYRADIALLPGVYYAGVQPNGRPAQFYDALFCPPACQPTDATPIVLAAAELREDIDFRLLEGARIGGRVTRASDGAPVPDVLVEAFDEVYGSGAAFTDANGDFLIAGLAPGYYFVTAYGREGLISGRYPGVQCPGGACPYEPSQRVLTTPQQEAAGIDFSLATGARIGGTVLRRDTQQPVANLSVVMNSIDGPSFSARTGADGSYLSEEGLPAGSYLLSTLNQQGLVDQMHPQIDCDGICRLIESETVQVQAGDLLGDIDFNLIPGVRLAGRVTSASSGAALAFVVLRLTDASGRLVASGRTNSAGDYTTLQAVPPGSYHLGTRNLSGHIDLSWPAVPCGLCAPPRGEPIALEAAGIHTGFDFALPIGSLVSGEVRDARSGAPLADIEVIARDAQGGRFAFGSSDQDGSFVLLQSLPSGSYTLETFNFSGYRNVVWPDIPCFGRCDYELGTPLSVSAPAPLTGVLIEIDSWPVFADRFE
jgi:hypothetical protein